MRRKERIRRIQRDMKPRLRFTHPMWWSTWSKGWKKTFVCFEHRKACRRGPLEEIPRCPECGEHMIRLTDYSTLPKVKDDKGWQELRRKNRHAIIQQTPPEGWDA